MNSARGPLFQDSKNGRGGPVHDQSIQIRWQVNAFPAIGRDAVKANRWDVVSRSRGIRSPGWRVTTARHTLLETADAGDRVFRRLCV